MDGKSAYREFLRRHEEARSGERGRRLVDGHGHAEKAFALQVWWPAFHDFDGLHPEYEVVDYKDGFRYLDFAYIHAAFRVAIEIDGFGPHLKQASRWQFSDSLRRQNQLVIDGWYVLRFSYDDIQEHPRQCQQTLHQLVGRLLGHGRGSLTGISTANAREVVSLAMASESSLTPIKVAHQLGVSRRTAARLMMELVRTGWLESTSGKERIRSYRLRASRRDPRLWRQ